MYSLKFPSLLSAIERLTAGFGPESALHVLITEVILKMQRWGSGHCKTLRNKRCPHYRDTETIVYAIKSRIARKNLLYHSYSKNQ
jgi:hypothetical protein